jgi:hypothetical protein
MNVYKSTFFPRGGREDKTRDILEVNKHNTLGAIENQYSGRIPIEIYKLGVILNSTPFVAIHIAENIYSHDI